MPLLATCVALVLFATGVGPRPAGPLWDPVYDIVLYNAVFLGSAVVCLQTARRYPAEARAWGALAVAELMNVGGNLVHSLIVARLPEPPSVSWADWLHLASFPAACVALIALLRVRVPHLHLDLWLDGVIGALGAAAVGVVFLDHQPAPTDEDVVTALMTAAYPMADLLLLVVVCGVAVILGRRNEASLWLIAGGLGAILIGDLVYMNLSGAHGYVEGGPLDLTWLSGVALLALAADRVGAGGRLPAGERRRDMNIGWQRLAVPVGGLLAGTSVLAAGWYNTYPALAAWCAIGSAVAGLARGWRAFQHLETLHEVHEQARTDELTGLPNRRALLQRAESVVAEATAVRPAALLMLDLDGFKQVNDSLGHHAGDELLRQIAPRLSATLLPGQLAARLGGDEFALLLPEVSLDEALEVAHRVRNLVTEPVILDGLRVRVGTSIGVATAPVPAADVEELLRCADTAMYAAKSSADGVRAFVPEPTITADDRLQMSDELRTAVRDGELQVFLQPQMRLEDEVVVAVEALVRWTHPVRGLLTPSHILPAAEQAGLTASLADAVLRLALAAAERWWPTAALPVSVNLGAANVSDLGLPGKVAGALRGSRLPAWALTLELAEHNVIADLERGRVVLAELRALGARTAIQDYGTGPLVYVRGLPTDELKLDASLIHGLDADPAAVTVVKHIAAFAHDLGFRTVAQNVQRDATLARLAGLGCDIAQGNAIAPPMPLNDFLDWLAALPPQRLPARLSVLPAHTSTEARLVHQHGPQVRLGTGASTQTRRPR